MKKIGTIIFIIVFSLSMFSQTTKLNIAEKKYENYSYIDAISIYKKVAEKGYKSPELFRKLGNSYYFTGDLMQANEWYSQLFQLKSVVEPEYYYRYSQTLKSLEDYKNANKYLEKFNKLTNDSRGILYAKNRDYLDDIKLRSGKDLLKNLSINTEFYDFGASLYNKSIVFTSSREDKALIKKVHEWTDQNFTDLYISKINEDGSLTEPENFSKTINSKFNESTPVFTKDGKTMYFTRNNYLDGKKGKNDARTTLIKIYSAQFVNNQWTNVLELPFNSDNYSTAHPALSVDEKILYFSSDMPGTIGGADIFKVTISNERTFGKPENLGTIINTEGRESFPFIDFNNNLYYSSDGLLGLGGLDIFKASWTNNQYEKPVNMAQPINSSKDDFGYIITRDKKGYFTSNRENGLGFDDIYAFYKCVSSLYGVVTDLKTNDLLPNARIRLYDEDRNVIAETVSNEQAYYSFEVECNTKYFVRAEIEEYEPNEVTFVPEPENFKVPINITLDRNIFKLDEGTDIAKIFDISNIYFDLDKYEIRPDAAKDLQKVIEVLKEYSSITLSINAHTDSRGSDAYNKKLSEQRANATLQFMVKNGIDSERLNAVGYGETKLINNCTNNVKCSEEAHQQNRRSEFIINKL